MFRTRERERTTACLLVTTVVASLFLGGIPGFAEPDAKATQEERIDALEGAGPPLAPARP